VYVVTVTATDDTGQTGSVSQQLDITNSGLTADIVFSPEDPIVGDAVRFTAANATAPDGASITEYEWNFGDHTGDDGGTAEGRTVQHSYSAARTYVVRLTITDSRGNVGTVTETVTVEEEE
jgi:PKD repeat protein